MATVKIDSLDGIAALGVQINGNPGEMFQGGSISGDRMVLCFVSTTIRRLGRKQERTTKTRIVTAQRDWRLDSWYDGDFVWLPVKEVFFTTTDIACPRNYHAWHVPSVTVNGIGGCTSLRPLD